MKENNCKKDNFINCIFIIILFIYPLRKVWVGIDLMDAGYALGNYRYFETMNETWKLATYLSNVVGVIFEKLPFGDTWIGMNIYTSLPIGATAAFTYNYLNKRIINNKFLTFAGELVTLSLCWGPSTIIYHYFGYILMTASFILIHKALFENKKTLLTIAGVILGLAVIARMPNITYMALIVPLWFYSWLGRREDREWFRQLLNNTFYCVLGYVIGLGLPLGFICVKYGINAYPDMISSLFGMTDTATDYKPTSMVTAMFSDYIAYFPWLAVFGAYIALCIFIKKLWDRIWADRYDVVYRVLFILGFLVLIRFCYGRGMFGLDYTSYFAMYKLVTVFLLIGILFAVWLIFSGKVSNEHKFIGCFLLVIIFVTPLGSNNGLYPIISNLFVVAPVTIGLGYRYLTAWQEGKPYRYIAKTGIGLLILLIALQSVLFGIFFVFHDSKNGDEEYVKASITGSDSTKGIYTTAKKNEELNNLGIYLLDMDLQKREVILYGNIPAIAYIYDMTPAIYTTWADLDSNSYDKLVSELTSNELIEKKPLVIMSKEIDTLENNKKLEAIYEFIDKEGYTLNYESDMFYVYH